MFDTVLQWCGFQLDSLPYWLKDQSVNNWSLVGASIWRYLGQNVILFIGAMMSIDGSLYEAAEIDGANKFQTIIEDDAFIGSDTQLVAPVTVGRGATLGAGTTLTKDAPPDTLTLSRAKQVSVTGWKRPVKTKK